MPPPSQQHLESISEAKRRQVYVGRYTRILPMPSCITSTPFQAATAVSRWCHRQRALVRIHPTMQGCTFNVDITTEMVCVNRVFTSVRASTHPLQTPSSAGGMYNHPTPPDLLPHPLHLNRKTKKRKRRHARGEIMYDVSWACASLALLLNSAEKHRETDSGVEYVDPQLTRSESCRLVGCFADIILIIDVP
jgi:hypothetical protein